ncbi:MAG TPA: GNAT family N-acetyltransferase [Chryseosolibacter sp.]|jgi:N-acetylglutamate synthase and related acetyltransferases
MEPVIRKISTADNLSVAQIIRTVMPEFGAGGQGFAIHDREVDDMYGAYNLERSAYLVCEADGKLLGGGGVGPLVGGESDTCELKKMYFLPEGRGRGLGQKLLTACLRAAREMEYRYCYLETFNTMAGAMKVYEKNGFERIPGPLGNTGHFACDVFYRLKL